MQCICYICGIHWQDRIPNTEVLARSHTNGIEYHIIKHQLRWVGHLVRMLNIRIPKKLFFGQLELGHRHLGRPYKRFKDTNQRKLQEVWHQEELNLKNSRTESSLQAQH